MSDLTFQQQLDRLNANEERLDKFVNDPVGYTASDAQPVKSLKAFGVTLEGYEGEALAAKNAAEDARDTTVAAKDEALDARDAAQAATVESSGFADDAQNSALLATERANEVASRAFVSTASGLAATTSGQLFRVGTADPQVYLVYENNAGSAVLVSTENIANGNRFVVSNRANTNAFSLTTLSGRVLLKLDRLLGWIFGGSVTTTGDLSSQTKVSGPVGEFPQVDIGLSKIISGGRLLRILSASGRGYFSIFNDGTVAAQALVTGSIATSQLTIDGQTVEEIVSENTGIAINQNQQVSVSQNSVDYVNAHVTTKPADVIKPGAISINDLVYGDLTAVGVPGIAWTGNRLWVVAYGHNIKGEGAGGLGIEQDGAYAVLRYCDNPYEAVPTFYTALYIYHPGTYVDVADGLTKPHAIIDPQVYAMPDGRLFVSYATTKVGTNNTENDRGGYGFFINNPRALSGYFELGRTYFLDRGVPMRPHLFGHEVRTIVDQWNTAAHFGRLVPTGHDGFTFTRIADVPDVADANIYESSIVPISGGRARVYQRGDTNVTNIYTSLSAADAASFPAPTLLNQFSTPTSRAFFMRSNSGRVIGSFNQHTGGVTSGRRNMTVALSEDEGVTFPSSFIFSPGTNTKTYPVGDISPRGEISICFDQGRVGSTTGGPKVIVALIPEEKVFDGTIALGDVRLIEAFALPQYTL